MCMNCIKFPLLTAFFLLCTSSLFSQDFEDGRGRTSTTKKKSSTDSLRKKSFEVKEVDHTLSGGLVLWTEPTQFSNSLLITTLEYCPRFILATGKIQSSLSIAAPINIGIGSNNAGDFTVMGHVPVLLEGSLGHFSHRDAEALVGIFAGIGVSGSFSNLEAPFNSNFGPSVSAGLRMGNMNFRSYTFRLGFTPSLKALGNGVIYFSSGLNF